MSKLTTTRSTGKSLGYPSQKQIDMWSSEGMKKASLFSKRQHKTINFRNNSKLSIENQEQMAFAFNSSLNQLREKTKTEKSNTSTISNRMSYMEVQLRRKRQIMEVAKSKYQRMIEVRQKSFVEKKQLSKERQKLTKQYRNQVTMKASRVRAQRKNSTMSVQIVREKNQTDAIKIKNQSFINEQIVAERKQKEVQKKKMMVENMQRYADMGRSKLKNLQENKQRQAKATHNYKMLQQYLKGEVQRRKNIKFFSSFKSKVRKIEEEASLVNKELSQYEKMLGWNYSNRGGKKPQTTHSFYMTH